MAGSRNGCGVLLELNETTVGNSASHVITSVRSVEPLIRRATLLSMTISPCGADGSEYDCPDFVNLGGRRNPFSRGRGCLRSMSLNKSNFTSDPGYNSKSLESSYIRVS